MEISERDSATIDSDSGHCEVSACLEAKKFIEWKSQPFFRDKDIFSRRAAMSFCTPEELAYLVSEPPEALSSRVKAPGWMEEISIVLGERRPDGQLLPEVEFSDSTSTFLAPFEPLLLDGCRKLEETVLRTFEDREALPFVPTHVLNICFPQLYKWVLLLIGRTMTLELNVARVKGLLNGETAEERFAAFGALLREEQTQQRFLDEYPVLLRLVATAARQWRESNLEFLDRLAADWPQIRERFGFSETGDTLASLKAGLGDRHCDGRSVLLVTFESGRRLIYKPRSLAADESFQALLGWLNGLLGEPTFKIMGVLDRETYGWAEYVERQPCYDSGELCRFYERQGQYLALLHALGATDAHHENLIAQGEHPVLIDLETLFRPTLPLAGEGGRRFDPDLVIFSKSLLGTGLLPQPVAAGADGESADSSGLGAAAGRLSPFPELTWENIGTDQMQVVRKRVRLPEGKNRPRLEGVEIRLSDQADAILAGFSRAYRVLWQRREELETLVTSLFAHVRIRSVLRATRSYATLFRATLHPDALRDAVERAQLLDRLWIGVMTAPCLERCLKHEVDDLARGDIPYFTTTPSLRSLTPSSGEIIEGFFERSGLEVFREKLATMGEEDLERQVWLIRSALLGQEMKEPDHFVRKRSVYRGSAAKEPEWFLTAAREIGDRVATLSYETSEHVAWLGLKYRSTAKHFFVEPMDFSLYSGHAGASLFLTYLGLLTGESRFEQLGRKSARSMMGMLDNAPARSLSCGAFEGWSGVVYALTHLGVILQSEDLLNTAREIVVHHGERLRSDSVEEVGDDIIGGLAGCIGALAPLHRELGDDTVLETLRSCGRLLVTRAVEMPAGIGWPNPVIGPDPLPGFAHGNAGIAWALMLLYGITGEDDLRQTALNALRYVATLCDGTTGNWLPEQVRETTETGISTLSVAWCHGSPGIALGRLPFLTDGVCGELDVAVETTLRDGFGANHSLCHGDLGNLDCLLKVASARNDTDLLEQVRCLGSQIAESAREQGWRCGVPRHAETPGLMAGLAGIGFGLLRLAMPDRVPCILALDPATNRSQFSQISSLQMDRGGSIFRPGTGPHPLPHG